MTRVLIVDDHASFRQLAVRMLTHAGFEVVGEAVDAESALSQTALLLPDVVLLDVMLPDRSGLDVASEIMEAGATVRVLLTSSRERLDFGSDEPFPDGCVFVPKHELSAAVLSAALEGWQP
jgi:DNA-binding NarL/FixJ family response regulator